MSYPIIAIICIETKRPRTVLWLWLATAIPHGILLHQDGAGKINEAINSVAESQNKAAQITKDYELGKETDLTKVIMQQQISNIAFQMTLNVRNKVLSSYKDIMNMPV